MSRDVFLQRTGVVIDVIRLAGNGRAQILVVEIRGVEHLEAEHLAAEHLEAELAFGKRRIICCSDSGQTTEVCSLLGLMGFL